jgi:hypothetical protein
MLYDGFTTADLQESSMKLPASLIKIAQADLAYNLVETSSIRGGKGYLGYLVSVDSKESRMNRREVCWPTEKELLSRFDDSHRRKRY